MIEQGDDGLQKRRNLDDLGAEGVQTIGHVVDAAGHGLRVFLDETLDQLFDHLFVLFDFAIHKDDLEKKRK